MAVSRSDLLQIFEVRSSDSSESERSSTAQMAYTRMQFDFEINRCHPLDRSGLISSSKKSIAT